MTSTGALPHPKYRTPSAPRTEGVLLCATVNAKPSFSPVKAQETYKA